MSAAADIQRGLLAARSGCSISLLKRGSHHVHDIGLTALDLGLRGAASGLFTMMVLVLIRLRPANPHAVLGLVMSAGGAGFAIATAPFIPTSTFWWTLPLLSAQPVVFWLWARAAFDDDFALRPWHGAVWLAVVVLGFIKVASRRLPSCWSCAIASASASLLRSTAAAASRIC